jgi:tetratricopeptide (TPR) repeat protein
MGDLAREQGTFSEAGRLFEHAAAIFKDATGERHEFYVHQLSNRGSVYLAQRRYRDAEKTLRSAVDRLSIPIIDTPG